MIENKTIFIAHNWWQTSVSRQSVELAKFFSIRNRVVFFNAKKRGLPEDRLSESLTVVEWPGKRPVTFSDLLFAIKMARRYTPDIIITNFGANNIMLFVSWLFGVKIRMAYYHTMVSQYIADKGTLGLQQRFNIRVKRFFFKKATHMLCPSSAAKKDLLQYYKVDSSKAIVIANALQGSPFINQGKNNLAIGFIGRLNKSKGVDILINAFIHLQKQIPALKLYIVGSGEEQAPLQHIVAAAGLQDNVIFKGSINNELIFDFLASVNFLVVPSRMDNLPTVVLEAFSAATPVIGSNSGGIPDMVQDKHNGLLFEKENIIDLWEKMKILVVDDALRNTMAQNALSTFNNKYSIVNLPQRFEALLETKH